MRGRTCDEGFPGGGFTSEESARCWRSDRSNGATLLPLRREREEGTTRQNVDDLNVTTVMIATKATGITSEKTK